MPKGTPFHGELRQQVVEDVLKNKLSYSEAMRKHGISGKMTIQRWERIYLEEGAEGLYVDHRRGIPGTERSHQPAPGKQDEKTLLKEVERLRAENDYLKKLHALVSERVQRKKKRK
jgi:transposase-like protein